MANLNAYYSLDMEKDEAYLNSLSPTIAQENHIQLSDGTHVLNFYGNFNFNVGTGTITELNLYKNGAKIYEFLQLNTDLTMFLNDSLTEKETDAMILATNDTFTGSNEYDYLLSYAGNDSINAQGGDDIINAGTGNDTVDGGEGLDTAIFSGNYSNYTLSGSLSSMRISGTDGNDQLSNIERLRFDDKTIAFDIDDNAGQAYRLYKAAFDRIPDSAGLGFWINALDKGTAILDVAAGFTNSVEFTTLYGSNNSNTDFVNLLYNNVLDRNADQGGLDFWLGHIDSGALTREGVLVEFSESAENQANVIDLIATGIDYTQWSF